MAATAPEIIKPFNVEFTEDQADEWFANAKKRLLTFHPGPAGGAGAEAAPKTTLIELIRTVLPGILLNSYHRDVELASLNAANENNDAEIDRLKTEMKDVNDRLKYVLDVILDREPLKLPDNKKRKPTNAEKAELDRERRLLTLRRSELESGLSGANGPAFRMAERNYTRRNIIHRRQDPFIPQIKSVIEHSTLLTGAEKAEVTLFVDGLIPYFQKKFIDIIENEDGSTKISYKLPGSERNYGDLASALTDQVRTLIPSVTGSEEISRGVAKLTANTRAAAAAVSRVPGFEEFNADMNRVLFNPGASNEEVIAKIAAMTPDMMSRLETQIAEKAKLNALTNRLSRLKMSSLPAAGTPAYSSLDQLTKRLEALSIHRVLFNPNDSSITTKEIIELIASLKTPVFNDIKTKLSDTTKRTALVGTLKKLARSSDNPSEGQTGYPQVRKLMELLAETKKGGGRHTRRAHRRMRRTRR